MFRRRMDFSWPLILVLVGLSFSVSGCRGNGSELRVIALVPTQHKSLLANELPSVTRNRTEASPPAVYRTVKPAASVAGNDDSLATSTPSTHIETQTAIAVPVEKAKIAPTGSRAGCRTDGRIREGHRRCRRTTSGNHRPGDTSLAKHHCRARSASPGWGTGGLVRNGRGDRRSAGSPRCSRFSARSQPCPRQLSASRKWSSPLAANRIRRRRGSTVRTVEQVPTSFVNLSTRWLRTVRRGRAIAGDCRTGCESNASRRPGAAIAGWQIRRQPDCSLPFRNPAQRQGRKA